MLYGVAAMFLRPAGASLPRDRSEATFANVVESLLRPFHCRLGKVKIMKRLLISKWLPIAACVLLSACAATGTKVTSTSDAYKSMANSQQWWCSQFGCGCTMDGKPATCSLAQACLSAGSCKQ
jgi:uncharacterized protein YceK